MASGQQRFEEEDWLGSYLSSSKYASDPKLNAEPKTKGPKVSFFSSSSKKGMSAGAAVAPQVDSGGADPNAGYNFSASSRASNRRRSWAAPPSGLPGQGQRANPAEAAAAKAIAAAQAAASAHATPNPPAPTRPSPVPQLVAATSRSPRGALPDTSRSTAPPTSYTVPPPPFPENGGGDMTAALQIAAARVVNSAAVKSASTAKNKRPAGGAALPGYTEAGLSESSETEWHEELTDKTTSFRRKSFSGSGRRVSLDYTDLEAVKERVQQAASLWAVAEDAESLSSTDAPSASKDPSSATQRKAGEPMPAPTADRGARSAAAQAMAAAKAIQAGEMTVDDDDEDWTDDEMEEGELSPTVVQPAEVQVPLAIPAQPAKKGSLIKKWLVFRK